MEPDDTETVAVSPWLAVDVLGEVRVTGPGGTRVVRGRQPQTVLAVLAIESRPVPRDTLADLLWGEPLPDHWSGALRGVVSKVRTALVGVGLPPSAVRAEDGMIRFDPDVRVRTDLQGVHEDLDRAERSHRDGDHQAAATACERVSQALVRPFLLNDDSDWSDRRRDALADLAGRAAHLHISALLGDGRPAEAATRARTRVNQDSLDESAHHLLIQALLADGRRTDALQAYEHLEATLETELAMTPAAATTDLVASLRIPVTGPATPDAATSTVSAGVRLGQRRPTRFHAHDDDPFVGREEQLGTLANRWGEIGAHRRPQVVVLEGPAGIGKTRLASRFATQVTGEGATVLWGRGRAGAEVAFGPWAEALGAVLDRQPTVLDALGARAAGLTTLLPHLQEHVGSYRPPDDGAVARTHLFAAVVATVGELAREPTLLVLDDLQWAEPDTLALLEVVLDGLEAPLLVVATSRAAPVALDRALMSVQRLVPMTTLKLGGLSIPELADLVVDTELAGALHARTAGLPFFVAEIAREARRSGRPIDADRIPDAAREWVARRIATLPSTLGDLLAMAAVVGTTVDLDLLAQVTGIEPDLLVERTQALVALGLLTDGGGGIELSHVITRDVVYESLGGTRRARLHRQVAEGLDTDGAGRNHGDLAHHWARAGQAGRAAAALHSRLAGDEALRRGAWELAASCFGRAIEHTDEAADEPVEGIRALIGSGLAHHRLGDLHRARHDLDAALAAARHLGLAPEQAEATLALVGRAGRGAGTGEDDARHARLLRDAIAALDGTADVAGHDLADPNLGDHESPAHDRDSAATADGTVDELHRREVLACALDRELALALLFTDAVDERIALAERSLHRAQMLRPPVPAATAQALLGRRLVALGPGELGDRLADLDEVLRLPSGRLRPETLISAHCYRHEDLVRLGRFHEAAADLDRADALADQHRDPYWQWAVLTWRGLWASMHGELEQAEDLAHEACDRRPDVAEARACLGVNLVNLRLLQGRSHEMLDVLSETSERSPQIPCYRAVLALCAADAGDDQLAEASYRAFADAGFTTLPLDTNRFLGLAVLADVAVHLGDGDGGRQLTDLLAPYRGQWVVLNCYGGGGAHWGPVAHQLARLAVLDGRRDDADGLFAEAADASRQAPAMAARIAHDRARHATTVG